MTSVAIGIVAHPSRGAMAHELAERTSAEVLSCDSEGAGEQANHQAALEQLLEYGTEWVVWLEDDAVPCADLRTRLLETLDAAPDGVVSLYLGTGRWAGTAPRQHEQVVRGLIEDADRDGSRWITAGSLWHAVGVAIPRDRVADLLQHLRGSTRPTDEAVSDWCRRHRVAVHYTHPSLVDHRDEPRLVQARERHVPRRAWRFEEATSDLRDSV